MKKNRLERLRDMITLLGDIEREEAPECIRARNDNVPENYLRGHLSACSACREYYAMLETSMAILNETGSPVTEQPSRAMLQPVSLTGKSLGLWIPIWTRTAPVTTGSVRGGSPVHSTGIPYTNTYDLMLGEEKWQLELILNPDEHNSEMAQLSGYLEPGDDHLSNNLEPDDDQPRLSIYQVTPEESIGVAQVDDIGKFIFNTLIKRGRYVLTLVQKDREMPLIVLEEHLWG